MRPDFNKMELIPAIVQDYQTKEVLMLAYVNEEAYDKMLELKQTVFYSRSRQKLWHKGEESGHFQDIKGMYLDCDLDTLLIYVKQTGAACHTGAYSCFFNEVQAYDARDIFRELEKTIADRKIHPVEKSYTNYLLNEGVDKICKKVGEEASETIIAAKNDNKEDKISVATVIISIIIYSILMTMSIFATILIKKCYIGIAVLSLLGIILQIIRLIFIIQNNRQLNLKNN